MNDSPYGVIRRNLEFPNLNEIANLLVQDMWFDRACQYKLIVGDGFLSILLYINTINVIEFSRIQAT